MKIVGFMHIAFVNRWGRKIVKSQLRKIKKYGLFDKSDKIFVTLLGKYILEEDYKLFQDNKFDLFVNEDIKLYEFATLKRIEDYIKKEKSKIWYIHSKGVFHPNDKCVQDWRNYLEYFVIEKNQECINALDYYDACGVNFQFRSKPYPFFAGNFWWARSEYLKKLPLINSLNLKDRYLAESWIGMDKDAKIKNFFESHINHYASLFPRRKYANRS